MGDAAGGSSEEPRATPKVADVRTLNVLADANRGYRILDVYNSHMTHTHEVNPTDTLEEFEGIMAGLCINNRNSAPALPPWGLL
jgi:hypothetical protein